MRLLPESMQRPAAPVRSAALERLNALEREIPEWESWTGMLRVLAHAIGSSVWCDPVCDPTDAGEARPRLDGQCIRISGQAMLGLFRPLLDIDPARTLPLAHASITGGAETIDATAQTLGMSTAVLATVLHAATMPLLNACAAQLAREAAVHWPHGYCPVCGARPLLAELIGLDRSRRLRCGRCGTGWDRPWLVCAFCQEADHARLGALVSGTAAQGQKVETCSTCGGYLKTIAVLSSGSHVEVLLADLETVALDVAARGEGLVRPPGLGHPLSVRLFSEVAAQ